MAGRMTTAERLLGAQVDRLERAVRDRESRAKIIAEQRDALAAQVAVLTAEHARVYGALFRRVIVHRPAGPGRREMWACDCCGASSYNRAQTIPHDQDCPLATTPPVGAQEGWRDAEGMFPTDEPADVTIR